MIEEYWQDQRQSPMKNTLLTPLSLSSLSPSRPLVLSSFMLPLSGTTSRTTPPTTPTSKFTKTSLFQSELSLKSLSSLPPSPRLLSSPSQLNTASSLSNSNLLSFLQMNTRILFVKLLEAPLKDPQPPPSHRDITIEVAVTLKTLKYMQIFSGSWVLFSSLVWFQMCELCVFDFLKLSHTTYTFSFIRFFKWFHRSLSLHQKRDCEG